MHYLIDGYNLFFSSIPDFLPLKERREEFIIALNDSFEALHIQCTLVFDSHASFSEAFPSKRVLPHLEVVFSPEGLSADDYIVEYLRAQAHPQAIVLVTSDQKLMKQAKALGAKTDTLKAFFAFLKKKGGKKREFKEEKLEADTETELHRLLTLFEERMKEEQDLE